MTNKEVLITLYKWEGKKWFFKITSDCEECDTTEAMLKDMMKREFKGKNVKLVIKPWLDNIFAALLKRGTHPPVLLINGKKFHQYSIRNPIFNRKKFKKTVLRKL